MAGGRSRGGRARGVPNIAPDHATPFPCFGAGCFAAGCFAAGCTRSLREVRSMEVRWRLDVRRPLGRAAFVPDHSNVRFPVSSPTWLGER